MNLFPMNLSQPEPIKVVGLDPSLRNWGVAIGQLIPGVPESLLINHVSVINPLLSKSKQVRQNSLDLESAKQLTQAVLEAVQGARAIFVEVPVGSQSARAMASYGICVGILGALRGMGISLHEVTPTEVKLAGPGIACATKLQMIQWALQKHPEANWPMYQEKGKNLITLSKAEHQADAVAAIYAGMACNSFQQVLSFLGQTHQ